MCERRGLYMHRVYLETVGPSPESVSEHIDRAINWLGTKLSPGDLVVLKPNLAYPVYEPGVCTSPAFMEGIMIALGARGVRMMWVEGDGGNSTYSADEAFLAHGFAGFRRKYGVSTFNVCSGEKVAHPMLVARRHFSLPVPRMFLDRQFDMFISVPVFKTHVFTTISLGFKNLWGLIPDSRRMYYHYLLDWGIVGLAKALRPDAVFVDGIFSLDREGPINGVPLYTKRTLISNSPGAGESVGAQIMGVDPEQLRYFRFAKLEGLIPDAQSVQMSRPIEAFQTHKFVAAVSPWTLASRWVSRHPRLQRLTYHSPLSHLMYTVMDMIRPSNRQASMRRGSWRTRN